MTKILLLSFLKEDFDNIRCVYIAINSNPIYFAKKWIVQKIFSRKELLILFKIINRWEIFPLLITIYIQRSSLLHRFIFCKQLFFEKRFLTHSFFTQQTYSRMLIIHGTIYEHAKSFSYYVLLAYGFKVHSCVCLHMTIKRLTPYRRLPVYGRQQTAQ